MFERLAFGEEFFFVLSVPFRLFFEAIRLGPGVCRGNGVKILLDAFGLIKIPVVGYFVLQQHGGILVAQGSRGFECFEASYRGSGDS